MSRPRIRSLDFLIFSLALLFSASVNSAEAEKEAPSIRHVSAETCKMCHQEIYSQWKGSMHAQSTALEDGIHAAFYKKVVGDPTKEGVKKGGKYPICLQCHSPAAAKDKKTKLDAKPSYSEGINCVACHAITKFKGTVKPEGGLRLGMKAYEYSDTKLQGPNGLDKKNKVFHPMFDIVGNPGVMKTSDACMGCHDQRPNGNKVSLCQTGDEVRAGGGSATCQSCHMPIVNGMTSHTMLGGHSGEMVASGLAMTIDAEKSGDMVNAELTLFNRLPHNFPTGAPFRNFYVKVTAYDAAGEPVWKNTESHPVKDDPQSMFMYKLGDADGKPAPPPKATQVLGDTRLKPNETRKLKYEIPAKGVVLVKAAAYYDLVLPPIKKMLDGKVPAELLKPKPIGVAEVSL